jgi:predicted secreted protein
MTFDGTAVTNLTDVNIPEADRTIIDTTTHDTTGDYRTFVGGLKDGGTMTVSGKYPGGAGLDADDDDGTAKAVVVTFSDSSTATFDAILLGYGATNPLDDSVGWSASLKISGPVAFAAGA